MKVSRYAVDTARAIGYSPKAIERIKAAARLHDIGKIGISDEILNREGPLNEEEKELIESHPALGVSIIKNVESLKDVFPGVLHHHERFDGGGYPNGLEGENIPLDARIWQWPMPVTL
jgi:HD-GYP domain-containing protein (c-di-GMP phosphodiesterase class II)